MSIPFRAHETAAASRTAALLLLATLPLLSCGFSRPRSASDQQALAGCRADADRIYDAQNRYQLSERDSRDSPFSGSGTSSNPASGLSDRYGHQRMVDDCLSHSAAVPVNGAGHE